MRGLLLALLVQNALATSALAAAEGEFPSHPPMRPLPTPFQHNLVEGSRYFADADKGDDAHDGSLQKAWKTVQHAVRRLKPGDTLYLRGGTYREKVRLTRSGTAEAPIVIASHPGELAVVDGGLGEFFESLPATLRIHSEHPVFLGRPSQP